MRSSKDDVLIKLYDGHMNQLINRPVDELIPEMVAAQINIDFELETLKVQSIIARTMLIRKAKAFGGDGCTKYHDADFCLEGHCGDIIPKDELMKKWKDDFRWIWEKLVRAEEETKYLILTFNNKVIDPKFHSTCGGATDNSENVENNKVIYLRKVLCDHCKSSPYWDNVKDLDIDEIEKKLGVKLPDSSPFYGANIEGIVEDIERDEHGRVLKIKIGDKIFKGNEIREQLGLNSTRFGWKPTVLKFETRGEGHGLGVCQYGANEMAKQGKTLEEIFKYYYTGVDIKEYERPSKNKPLSNRTIVIDPGHGGEENPGVIGEGGLKEKDIDLTIAAKLKEEIERLGATAVLTRESDIYVPLSNRAKTGNEVRPDFFISIHMNSFGNSSISGTEIYHYRGDKEGEILSNFIMENMVKALGTVNKGVKTEDFYLLRSITTSSIHIEVAYLTNPEEETKLLDEKYIESIAASIAKGIIEYYS